MLASSPAHAPPETERPAHTHRILFDGVSRILCVGGPWRAYPSAMLPAHRGPAAFTAAGARPVCEMAFWPLSGIRHAASHRTEPCSVWQARLPVLPAHH